MLWVLYLLEYIDIRPARLAHPARSQLRARGSCVTVMVLVPEDRAPRKSTGMQLAADEHGSTRILDSNHSRCTFVNFEENRSRQLIDFHQL